MYALELSTYENEINNYENQCETATLEISNNLKNIQKLIE